MLFKNSEIDGKLLKLKILRVMFKLKLIVPSMIKYIKRFTKLKITKNSRRKLRRLLRVANHVMEMIL